MHKHVSSLFGSLFVAAPMSFYAAKESPCIAQAMQSYFSGRPHFHAFAFSVVAVVGLVFATSGNRHSIFARLAEWLAPKVGGGYASAGGTILGWVFGVCAAHLMAAPTQNWLPALALVALSALLVASPLITLHVAAPVATEFRNRWEKPLWKIRAIEAIGICFLITAGVAGWAQFLT